MGISFAAKSNATTESTLAEGGGGGGVTDVRGHPLLLGTADAALTTSKNVASWSTDNVSSTVTNSCGAVSCGPIMCIADVLVDQWLMGVSTAATDPGAVFLLGLAPADDYNRPDFANIICEAEIDATSAINQTVDITETTVTAGLWFGCIGLKSTTSKTGTNPYYRASVLYDFPVQQRINVFDNSALMPIGSRSLDADLSTATASYAVEAKQPLLALRISGTP